MLKRFLSTIRKGPIFKSSVTNTPVITIPNDSYKSVILLATPSLMPLVVKQAISIYDQGHQVFVAGVDTVKSQRYGFSELWLDEKVNVNRYVEFIDKEELRESDGINIVGVSNKNWKLMESKLKMRLQSNETSQVVEVPLANTLFTMNQFSTLFYLDKSHDGSDKLLTELDISLPKSIVVKSVEIKDKWTNLTPVMTITECIGNLIKKIDGNPASKYLENNDELMNIGSKETEVYVKINGSKRFQIIAGGGGWGPKADTLVLSPDAKIKKGDSIEIFMLTPENRCLSTDLGVADLEFESSVPELNYESEIVPREYEVFGCGSDLGFKFNGVNHKSVGERLTCIVEK